VDRALADHQLWQHKPIRVEVQADAYEGVEPYLPEDLRVTREGDRFVIEGRYGLDTFRDDRFVILVDGQVRTFLRWQDIPDQIDNVVEFTPDATHDLTFTFTFRRGGETVTHTHWVHHDMEPWQDRLRELLSRETNGGWNAGSDPTRRRGHPPLLRHGKARMLLRHLLQRDPDLPSG
jgi:hypothetical protein